MAGSNMLLEVHKQLQQVKGTPVMCNVRWVSILAVGDLYQYVSHHCLV